MHFQPLEIFIARAKQIVADASVIARLNDNADLPNAGGEKLDQLIMNQRPRNPIGADHRKQFLFHRMRRREMPRP